MASGVMDKSPDAFRTISEVAEDLDVPQHVLRFWETRFSHIKPLKRGGGRRYYRPDDVDLLKSYNDQFSGNRQNIQVVKDIEAASLGFGSAEAKAEFEAWLAELEASLGT